MPFLLSRVGDTSITSAFDWTTGGSIFNGLAPLLDASAMDDLFVLHMRDEPQQSGLDRTHAFKHVIDTFTTSSLTLTDGGTQPVSGAFAPTTANKTFTVIMPRGNFDSLYDATSQFAAASVAVVAHPVLNDFGAGATLAGVDMSDWSHSANLTESLGVSYADPFPASWSRMLQIVYRRDRFVLFPGTTVARASFGFYQRNLPLPGGIPSLAPTVATPGNIKLGGVDAGLGGKIDFDGVKPVTVSWTAASGAKLYQVAVFRVFANGNQTRTAFTGTSFTTNSSIDLPAEVLR